LYPSTFLEQTVVNSLKHSIFLLLFFGFPLASVGQQPSTFVYPSTPTGKHVEAYVTAYNSGDDEQMKRFFAQHVAHSALAAVPIDVRMGRYRQMHERTGKLLPRKVLKESPGLVSILVHTAGDENLQMNFDFEEKEPFGVLRIAVDRVQGEAESADRKPTDGAFIRAADSLLTLIRAQDKFSGTVLIARGDSVLFAKPYGLADRELSVPNSVDTKFNIGSINKSFTRLAILMLADEGKISLDDTIGKLLPEYPNKKAASSVRIRHLLEMSSGIGDFFGERYQATPKERLRSIHDYFPLFADKPLEFEPGTQERYSNGGFIVLGAIIEAVTGEDYYTFVRERIYNVAGMSSTGAYLKDELVPNRAKGYTREGGTLISNYATLPGRGSSAGGGYSTVHDLLNYLRAIGTGKLSAKGIEPMRGMGIAGGAPGLNAAIEWEGGNGGAIIVLANVDPPVAERVASQLRSWMPR
jgi:D-alanyl-D-alanine carboxypeptidase